MKMSMKTVAISILLAHAGLSQADAVVTTPVMDKSSATPVAGLSKRLIGVGGSGVARASSAIIQSGRMGDVAVIRGFASNIPLSDAAVQVAPAGWNIFVDEKVDSGLSVSWRGGREWTSVLGDMLSANGLRAMVDWTARDITIFLDATRKPLPPVSTKTIQAALPTWTLDPSMRLSENLIKWGTDDGWKVIWADPSVDYQVEAKASFSGPLAGKDGVMARVISAYLDAERPLAVEFFMANTPKVIEIRPLSFSKGSAK